MRKKEKYCFKFGKTITMLNILLFTDSLYTDCYSAKNQKTLFFKIRLLKLFLIAKF